MCSVKCYFLVLILTIYLQNVVKGDDWFSGESVLEALKEYSLNKECSGDAQAVKELQYVFEGYTNMLDSNGKLPSGILKGNLIQLGDYDQCVSVKVVSLKGKYCLLDVYIDVNEHFKNGPEVNAKKFSIGVCVPSTCTMKDLEESLDKFNFSLPTLNVTANELDCTVKGIKLPSTLVWITLAIVLLLIILTLGSSLYELVVTAAGRWEPRKLLTTFSVFTNWPVLIDTSRSERTISALFGLRTITVGWIILQNAYWQTDRSPVIDSYNLHKLREDSGHIIIINGFLAMDTFFLLNSMLLCISFFDSLAKNGTFDAPLTFVRRYIRLTPVLALAVLFESAAVNYLGEGPMWQRIHHQATVNCERYWWSTLLYIQNFVNPNELCIEQSWYLSADMQMYLLSPFILYALNYWSRRNQVWLILTTFLAIFGFINFGIVLGMGLVPNRFLEYRNNTMRLEFIPFYTRMTSWIVGLGLGYLICQVRSGKISKEMKPFWVTTSWILSTVLMTGALYWMFMFTEINAKFTALDAAIYLPIHRIAWAIGLAWIVYACAIDLGGIVGELLSWTFLQTLSKLSYSAFLIHTSVQRWRMGWLRTNVGEDDVSIVYYFVADFATSFIISIPIFIVLQQPFVNLYNVIFYNKKILPRPKMRDNYVNQTM